MTEAAVTGKDVRCLFINNGDDLLTLKKVVSKKSDKDDDEKQKNKKTDELNDNELNGNHNKTDSINFDIDNTSSLEPNLEMDSDTDRNITIDSICTQEDQESENIDVSNENSNEADVKSYEKDIQVVSIKCSDTLYSPIDTVDDNEYSHNLEDDNSDINNSKSSASYFNISSRAPLHSNNELDTTLDDPQEEVLINERKRKLEDSPELEQKYKKVLKLWNIIKYPFQKVTIGTSSTKNESSVSKFETIIEGNKSILLEPIVCKNNSEYLETKEINTSNNIETDAEIEDSSENITKQKFCSLM